ncbi:diacylglycerol kinase 4-like [Nymphaea colorata]|nr:diacylglycerol kinase 4-like [Nymphaea colorata]
MAEIDLSDADREAARVPARTSLIDSLMGCGLAGPRIEKEDLQRRVVIPPYLRQALSESISRKDVPGDAEERFPWDGSSTAPEAPIVVFVNSRSGGRHGPALMARLQELISEEQVFDLSNVKPTDFFQYGLGCLERLAGFGDNCASETREKLRVMVAGGDGTVGWVLGSISELYLQNRLPLPPTGIIPLGTGNDLSRSFGWGGSFPFAWKSAVKRSLFKATTGQVCQLDSWQIVVSMPSGEAIELPYALKNREECVFDKDDNIEDYLPEKPTQIEGVFYNYFSIGMDAQVAYGFHHLRNEKPSLAQGPISNKLIYSGYSCTQGWFFTPCLSDPSLRGLKNILRLQIKRPNSSKWEPVRIPSSVRAIVALNLPNYGSGRNPWGQLKPDYLEKRGFVEARADDGLLEIFGFKQGWHASFVMAELINAKHLAQAASIKLELRGGQWKDAYMQMDGEPWKQPIHAEHSTFVDIKRVPCQSLLINGL